MTDRTLKRDAHLGQELVLQAILQAAGDRRQSSLWRLEHDLRHALGKPTIPSRLLADHIAQPGERFDGLDSLAKTEAPHFLAPLCAAICRNALEFGRLEALERAVHFNNLSNYLYLSGENNEALEAIARAVEIGETLAKERSARFRPELGSSLSVAGDGAMQGRRIFQAIEQYEHAVECLAPAQEVEEDP